LVSKNLQWEDKQDDKSQQNAITEELMEEVWFA
jgi:hypothetical protein